METFPCIGLLLGTHGPNQQAIAAGVTAYLEAHALNWRTYSIDTPPGGGAPGTAASPPWGPELDALIGTSAGLVAVLDALGEGARYLPRVVIGGGAGTAPAAGERQVHIGTDDRAIGRLAAEHARAAGYGTGAVFFSRRGRIGAPRLEAYLERCQELGMATTAWLGREPGAGAAGPSPNPFDDQVAWLNGIGGPTALFFHQDRAAHFWREALRRNGLAVPGRFGLIGVDNVPSICTGTTPSLSSVALPNRHLGRLAAQAVHRMLGDGATPAGCRVAPLRVVPRDSTRLRASPLVERARERMRRRLRNPAAIDDLAGELGVSPVTLWRAFRQDLTCSPKDYQTRLRLEHAADLLLTTDRPLKRIAADCGYRHERVFQRAFGRRFGVSPGRFRQRHR